MASTPGHVLPILNDQYEMNKRAWKFEGYLDYSKWQASDQDFWIFRRFGSSSSRLILWRQDRIVQLETELQDIDDHMRNILQDDEGRNDSFRYDACHRWKSGQLSVLEVKHRRRDEIMEQLWHETESYYSYINQCSPIQGRPQAEELQIENNEIWLKENHKNAVDAKEQDFINKRKDLVAMVPAQRPPLERMLRRIKWLQDRLRQNRVPGFHVSSPSTSYFNDRKFQTLSNVIVVFICMLILIGTMVALNCLVSKTIWKEVTIGTAAIVLASFLAWATDKKAFEVVTSLATVTAIWMVYLQIDGKN